MATHDYSLANQSGASFRTDLNNALAAIQSNNSNSSSPATTVAYQWWADTTSGTLKIRNAANNAWIELFQLDGTLTLEDGSVSTPALAFRDDLNTGIFSSASDTFNIATGGVERVEFGAATIFNDTGADVDLRIEGDTDQNLLFCNAGGNAVGIGTSTPASKLHIFQSSASAATGNSGAGLSLESNSHQYIQYLGANNKEQGILFGDDADNDVGSIVYNHSDNKLTFATAANMRLLIDSDGKLKIGTSATPTQSGALNVFGTADITSQVSIRRGSADNNGPTLHFQKSRNTTDGSHTVVQNNDNIGSIVFAGNDGAGPETGARIMAEIDTVAAGNDMPARLVFSVTPDASDSLDEAMRIHNSGKVSINTTNNNGQLTVNGTSSAGHYVPSAAGGQAQSGIHVGGNHGNSGERGGAISFSAGGTGAAAIAARNESTDRDQIGMEFFTHNNSDHTVAADRRLRMSVGGYFYFGTQEINDPANNGSVGVSLSDSIGFLSVCRDSDIPLVVGVKGSDFQLIRFIAQGSQEGNISVSGSTVSYNGGHLSRWSQIKGISTTDKSARPTIYQGTVMSNLDDLCVWSYPDQFYTEQDKTDDQIPEGKKVGDLKKAAHTEENQQLNMTKISDTEGDKDVAGVFWTWDDTNDDYYTNDFYIAMTGDMVIRVAGSTTVARGDLMISAGDGTAKPQADDIIRSSTIAKIISTNATATYADGSKAYPCVLMAC